jgi:hypothetical protein
MDSDGRRFSLAASAACSELHDCEAGDQPEVTHVDGQHGVRRESFIRELLNDVEVYSYAKETTARLCCLCAVDSMHKLGQANRREHCSLITCCGNDLLEHLRYVIASAFGSDNHAGIQD